MKLVHLFAVATLSLVAFSVHAAPPVKDGNQGGGAIPFQEKLHLKFLDGFNGGTASVPGIVPAGKRAVIENVSYTLFLPSGQTAACFLFQNWNETYIASAPATGSRFSNASYRTLIFIEDDSVGSMQLACDRSGISGSGDITLTLTGWLVDAN